MADDEKAHHPDEMDLTLLLLQSRQNEPFIYPRLGGCCYSLPTPLLLLLTAG